MEVCAAAYGVRRVSASDKECRACAFPFVCLAQGEFWPVNRQQGKYLGRFDVYARLHIPRENRHMLTRVNPQASGAFPIAQIPAP